MTSKKSLSVKLALAISLLCFLIGCIFLALPKSLTKEVYAGGPSSITLGNFDETTHTFKDATGQGTDTYKYIAIYLGETMGDDDGVVLPTVTGYTADNISPYVITVEISSAQTAGTIATDYISKIEFTVADKQSVQVVLMNSASADGLFYNALNGHYYQFVDMDHFPTSVQNGTWFEAYEAAKAMTFDGRTGYLATITSFEEDLFVYKASGNKVGWLGGTTITPTTIGEAGSLFNEYANNDNHYDYWTWACGPEKDQMFYDVYKTESEADYERNIQSHYINWDWSGFKGSWPNDKEPNNGAGGKEDCLTTLPIGVGYSTYGKTETPYSWNDLKATTTAAKNNEWSPAGFLVEFGDQVIGDSGSSSMVSSTGYIGYPTQVDEEYYETLKDAIENIENNKEIALLGDNTEKIEINRAISFVINTNGYEFNKDNITAGEGYKLTTETNGNKITFTVIHSHNDVDFTTVWGDDDVEKTSMPTETGNYVLTCDVTLSETWTVPEGETNLCLNGYVINTNGGAFSVIKVLQNATLNLYDCGTTIHNGYVDSTGLWHLGTGEGTAKAITGGIITGGHNESSQGNGGGVYVDKGGFNMYGGNIVGNYATNGAGVHVSSVEVDFPASFNMSGGTISYNNAKTSGGGVYISNKNVVFNMTGGEITNNVVVNSAYGGGVFTQSDITLGGTAKITGNTAKGATNNVCLYTGKTITLVNPTTNGDDKIQIGVTTFATPTESKPVQITADGTADYSSHFFSDNDNYKVCFNNKGTEEDTTDDYLELRTAYAITNSTKEDDKETNHGYIVVDKNAVENEVVTVTVVPNSGYELSSLIYNDGTDHDITSAKSFTMQTTAVTISAEFIHIHGGWIITSNDNTLTATCNNNGCSETPYSVTLTLNADDEVFSADANNKYSSANAIWSNTELDLPQVVLKYYLETDDGPVLTTNKNSGATKNDDGSAPCWAGNYIVKATIAISETSYTIEKTFTITKAEISQVVINLDQPVATETAKSNAYIFPTQTMYSGEISWSPALLTGNKFDYNTVYTATITLTANSNHTFKDVASETTYVVEGWTKSTNSTETTLIYTKTFEKTGKIPQAVEITNDISKTYNGEAVSAPTYTKLSEDGTVTIEYKLATEEDTAYTTNAPINVGSYVVRVSVSETDEYVSGFATKSFTIAKQEANEITGLTQADVACGDSINPTATATFGTIVYSYKLASANDWLVLSDTNYPTVEGEYSLKAEVVGNDNYVGATCEPITFKVLAKGIINKDIEEEKQPEEGTKADLISGKLNTNIVIVIAKEDNEVSQQVKENIKQAVTEKSEVVAKFDIHLEDQLGVKVENISGNIYRVTLVIPDNLINRENFEIVYIDDEGNVEKFTSTMTDEKTIVFETDHFSTWAIVADELPITWVWFVVGGIALIGIILLLIFLLKRKITFIVKEKEIGVLKLRPNTKIILKGNLKGYKWFLNDKLTEVFEKEKMGFKSIKIYGKKTIPEKPKK